jgi:hypothetical protein
MQLMTTTISPALVPASVVASLTPKELHELEEAVKELAEVGVITNYKVKNAVSLNTGLRFLLLNTPLKYSIYTLPSVSDSELQALLAHDFEQLDTLRRFGLESEYSATAWGERFESTLAALGNRNITAATAARILDEMIESEPTDLSVPEIMMTAGYRLVNRWEPADFNAASLGELVRLFELHGVTEFLPKFKRWARRAA